MKGPGFRFRRRFLVGGVLVLAGTVLWYYWTQARQQLPPPAAPPPAPFVQLAGGGNGNNSALMEEREEYFDPTPLFIPTDRNFGQGPLPARVVRQPGQVFNDIPPKPAFDENSLGSFTSSAQAMVGSLPEMLARGNEAPFAGFGQVDSTLPPLAARAGYLEVKALADGELVMSRSLHGPGLPSDGFSPVEFLALVGRAGFVGDPVLTGGSGSEDVDNAVRNYLVKTLRLGDRLPPGEYAVSVGP